MIPFLGVGRLLGLARCPWLLSKHSYPSSMRPGLPTPFIIGLCGRRCRRDIQVPRGDVVSTLLSITQQEGAIQTSPAKFHSLSLFPSHLCATYTYLTSLLSLYTVDTLYSRDIKLALIRPTHPILQTRVPPPSDTSTVQRLHRPVWHLPRPLLDVDWHLTSTVRPGISTVQYLHCLAPLPSSISHSHVSLP